MKEEIKEIFGGGSGGEGSLLLKHPHDGVPSASRVKERQVPHQFPHHQQFGFHAWTYSK